MSSIIAFATSRSSLALESLVSSSLSIVLGIATGGAVLYAFVPSSIPQKTTLVQTLETASFLVGYAYASGAILAGLSSVTSLARKLGEPVKTKSSNTYVAWM
jgi:cyanate permease